MCGAINCCDGELWVLMWWRVLALRLRVKCADKHARNGKDITDHGSLLEFNRYSLHRGRTCHWLLPARTTVGGRPALGFALRWKMSRVASRAGVGPDETYGYRQILKVNVR